MGMYDTRALAYVMARGPDVLASSIRMQAGDGVDLPAAAMAAVAAVVPVVVAMTRHTVNMAAAMVTATCFVYGGSNMATHLPALSRVEPRAFL